MPFTNMLAEKSKSFEFALFLFAGVAVGLLFVISTGLSRIWFFLCILAIVTPFIVILTRNAKRLLLGLLVLCIPFNVDKNFFLHAEHTGGAVGLSISIWEISLYLLIAIWMVEVIFNKDQEIHFLPRWSIPILCLIGFSVLSTTRSSNITLSIFEIIQLAKVFLLFFYVANRIQTEENLKYVFVILFVTFFLENVLGLFQYFSGRSFDLAFLGGGAEKYATGFEVGTSLRVPGTFGTSNGFGSYLIMILPLLLSSVLYVAKRTYKLLCGSLFIMGGILLILTLSRGAWIGFIVSIGMVSFLVFTKSDTKLKTILIGGIFLLAVAILVINFRQTILFRFYADDHGSAMSRITMMRIAFEMLQANPFLGVGINNYSEVMASYDSTGLARAYVQPVHNVYLQIAAEIGIFGLCVLLWFLFLLYREGLRNFEKTRDFVSRMRIGLLGGLTGLLVHSLVNNGSLGDDIFILFWFLAGLVVASIRISSRIDKAK